MDISVPGDLGWTIPTGEGLRQTLLLAYRLYQAEIAAAASTAGAVVGGAVMYFYPTPMADSTCSGNPGMCSGPLYGQAANAIGASAAVLAYTLTEFQECEANCDLAYDRNQEMCRVDAAMRGYDPNRYRQCMEEVNSLYIECLQDCKKFECK